MLMMMKYRSPYEHYAWSTYHKLFMLPQLFPPTA